MEDRDGKWKRNEDADQFQHVLRFAAVCDERFHESAAEDAETGSDEKTARDEEAERENAAAR